MILKLLDKLGRKKVVLDRGPSHLKYREAKPWINRYYILCKHRHALKVLDAISFGGKYIVSENL